MILGVGVDLVSVPRIAGVWQRHGERFARRLLTEQEWPAYLASQVPERLLAKRFAAKEALAKAFGTGVRGVMGFQGVSVLHDALGAPRLALHGALAAQASARGIARLHLSLSDEREATVAFVVLESEA